MTDSSSLGNFGRLVLGCIEANRLQAKYAQNVRGGQNVRGVNVRSAPNVRGAQNVRDVNVRDVNVRGVNVRGVNVRGVDVRGARLLLSLKSRRSCRIR